MLSDFTLSVERQTSLGVGVDEYLRKVLIGALGEDKARGVIDRILFGRSSKGLEALKWMDPRAVAELIRQEHPQIIAIVLAYLDADQSAEVLGQFPEPLRADVVMRIATLDGIQPTALHELDEVIEKQFAGSTGGLKTSVIGGVKTAANILNFMDSSRRGERGRADPQGRRGARQQDPGPDVRVRRHRRDRRPRHAGSAARRAERQAAARDQGRGRAAQGRRSSRTCRSVRPRC